MLPPAVDQSIRALADDRTSGASRLARLALEVMELVMKEAKDHADPKDLAEAAGRISEAQPAMAIVHNVSHLVARLVSEGLDPKAVLDETRTELDTARDRIARTFLKVAPTQATIVTLSHSENVFETLRLAHARDRVRHVYVLESRPGYEGRALATALAGAGIPITLVPDALGPSMIAEATCAVVGADAILRDGAIVNKIGTYGIALSAADHEKPVYVLGETLKFDARYDANSWPRPPVRDPEELWDSPPEGVRIMNQYFEITPGRLVTTVVTERGTYAPDVIRTMLDPGRRESR